MTTRRLLLTLLFLSAVIPFGLVYAQESSVDESFSGSGLTISPFLIEQRLSENAASTQSVTVTNATNSISRVSVTVRDFVPTDDNENLTILPDTSSLSPGVFSLSSWISLPSSVQFDLQPGERRVVDFTITPPTDAEPGTHYAAVLFKYGDSSTSAGSTETDKEVGAIVIAKIGSADERGAITRFAAKGSVSTGGPIDFQTTFSNTGNVHLRPKGRIEITDTFGKLVTVIPVNKDALIALPKTNRSFAASWDPSTSFGKYTAKLIFVYGDNKLESSSVLSYWVVPVKAIMYLVAGIAISLICFYFIIRRYNQWIINRSKK